MTETLTTAPAPQIESAAAPHAAAYLKTAFAEKGVGGWRSVYLKFIAALQPGAVLEVGAGAPDFLRQTAAARRIAVDLGDRYAEEFRAAGVTFVQRDLERVPLDDLGPIDVAICSDVFEHLINPAFALAGLASVLAPAGVLFSHVPNEYRLGPALGIMLGQRETAQYHQNAREWDDPHLRRFSDRGYRAFLETAFRFNIRLTALRYGRAARTLTLVGLSPPYFLQGGPTYASTNSPETAARVEAALARLKRSRRR